MVAAKEKARIFRERFYGRQDVYGRKWRTTKEDGTQLSGYAPVCANLWTDGCHLKLKTPGKRCDNCEIRQYEPVTDKSVLSHINGDEQIIHYVLLLDNTVKFAALDFDCKPGKEDKGYSFAEVRRAWEVLKGWGIPSALARSTTAGYHLYIFLDDFYPAYKIRSLLYEVFERAGFMENLRMGIKPVPEIFPKQSYNSPYGIGNGIKPPCVEPQFAKQRNCFIDETDHVIGADGNVSDEQWKHLDTFPRVSPAQIDEVLTREAIEVIEDKGPSSAKAGSYNGKLSSRGRGSWQPAINGSIEKVLEGCAALRRVRDKALASETLGHAEGFGLFHICMSTNDGLDWFKKNVPGWGTDDRQLKQLQHSMDKNYSPWTCRKMQENSICQPKTVCFKKKPPVDTVEGQAVVRTDLPESEWPEPSPIRYAFGKGEDFLKKIIEEAMVLKLQPDGDQKIAALKALVYRAQVFDDEQQKELKTFMKKEKIARAGEIAKIFNEAGEESTKNLRETLAERGDILEIHDNTYKKNDPYGYSLMKMVRSRSKMSPICDTDFTVEEIRSYVDDGEAVKTTYHGTARSYGIERHFELDTAKWRDNSKFMEYFEMLLGDGFNILRQNVDAIRQAAMAFSKKAGILRTEILATQGWHNDAYLMPSVIVDKDGLRPNTEKKVDISGKEFARMLDFKILTEDEFTETMLHLKTDFLNAWPRTWSMVGLAHAMLPALTKVLSLKKKPTLFYEGLTGTGKTECTHMLQWFWGSFDTILNLTSSAKGVSDVAYDCKDALVVIDDFKGLGNYQIDTIRNVIQYAYDGHVSMKLNRDGTQRKAKAARGTLVVSGECFISGDASVVARTVLIEAQHYDKKATTAQYEKCKEWCHRYQGITPRFIHWVLNTDMTAVKPLFLEVRAKIRDHIGDRQNADRIAFNLALNHISWQLWVDFMLFSRVVSPKEKDELVHEHMLYIGEIAREMAGRCEEEQSGMIFATVLQHLIESRSVCIRNLEGFNNPDKPEIGYVSHRDGGDPDTAYLKPGVVWEIVNGFLKAQKIAGTQRSMARQLMDLGIIKETEKGRNQKSVRIGDKTVRVWIVDLTRLGIRTGTNTGLKVVGSTAKLFATPDQRPEPPPIKESDIF